MCWIDVADLVFRGISTPWSASIATGHRSTARTMMTSTMQKAILDIPSYELSPGCRRSFGILFRRPIGSFDLIQIKSRKTVCVLI